MIHTFVWSFAKFLSASYLLSLIPNDSLTCNAAIEKAWRWAIYILDKASERPWGLQGVRPERRVLTWSFQGGSKKDSNNLDLFKVIPSWELTYPILKVLLKMIFLFPRWDMLIPWWVLPCSFFSAKAPEKWWDRKTDHPFLLGFGNFSGASC